jgi:hypothetical protein
MVQFLRHHHQKIHLLEVQQLVMHNHSTRKE